MIEIKPDKFICVACASHVHYSKNQWNFHRLCDTCFSAFDNQKMNARFGISEGYENVSDWLSARAR